MLLDPGARYRSMLDRRAVADLLDALSRRSEQPDGHALLTVLMLEIWLSSFFRGPGRSRSGAGGAVAGSARGPDLRATARANLSGGIHFRARG